MPLFYIAHRLFAAHDRALGAYIASQVADAAGPGSVFLPFCDTDEESLVSDCKGRTLFELDCARLRRITGMIAIAHGPSLDDGVCMETGYAAKLGVPVVLVTTDFQTYSPEPGAPACAFGDPLLETIAAEVVRVHRLGRPAETADGNRFTRFAAQNEATIRAAAQQAVTALLDATHRPPQPAPSADSRGGRLAYVEPSPYMTDGMWNRVGLALRSRGWTVRTASRFIDTADPVRAAHTDWDTATTADLAVVDVRGPESPPGAAAIIGARTAAGQPVLAAHSSTWATLADGREPNWRNLMIQYAVTARFCDSQELAAALDALRCTAD